MGNFFKEVEWLGCCWDLSHVFCLGFSGYFMKVDDEDDMKIRKKMKKWTKKLATDGIP
jgi:hypothetical protein